MSNPIRAYMNDGLDAPRELVGAIDQPARAIESQHLLHEQSATRSPTVNLDRIRKRHPAIVQQASRYLDCELHADERSISFGQHGRFTGNSAAID